MFCGNCGKEMIDNKKFCQFCGAEQTAVVIPAASIPVSATIIEPGDTASVPITQGIPGTPVGPSMGVEVSESVPVNTESTYASSIASTTAVIAPEASVSSIPTPNTIPTSNLDMPETGVSAIPVKTEAVSQAAPTKTAAGVIPQTVITIRDEEEKRPPERKYSLKHIVMCLATAAVMAVAAGVFAGLYFSVI